jgi:hypothetical protein
MLSREYDYLKEIITNKNTINKNSGYQQDLFLKEGTFGESFKETPTLHTR